MKRKEFFTKTAMLLPSVAIMGNLVAQKGSSKPSKPFVVDAGKSRFGEVVKFLGVHPNDLKISSKDTNGHLSVFDYVGTAKVGPMLHVHFEQDEIFTVIEGSYRFVVGNETHVLTAGQTIFFATKYSTHLDSVNRLWKNDLFFYSQLVRWKNSSA